MCHDMRSGEALRGLLCACGRCQSLFLADENLIVFVLQLKLDDVARIYKPAQRRIDRCPWFSFHTPLTRKVD